MAATACWEFQKCGRETECPAYPNRGFDCWNVEGTLCRGERQGAYDQKVKSCREVCKYYAGVIAGTIKVT
jgi:hypothetical protein